MLFNQTATASLPDPATVDGRTHDLNQGDGVACVWSASGTNPFLLDGAAVATITVPRGATTRVHSTGGKWQVIRPSGTRRIVSAKGATDGSGNVSFSFVPPFPTVPVVTHAVETSVADATEARISALSASSVTFNARRSPAVTILGISVLSASQPLVGATVHMTATEAG